MKKDTNISNPVEMTDEELMEMMGGFDCPINPNYVIKPLYGIMPLYGIKATSVMLYGIQPATK